MIPWAPNKTKHKNMIHKFTHKHVKAKGNLFDLANDNKMKSNYRACGFDIDTCQNVKENSAK